MQLHRSIGWLVTLAVGAPGAVNLATPRSAPRSEVAAKTFVVEHVLMLPGSPESVYDVTTGDLSGWWHHKFSEKPKRFYLEPKPGGGFYEIFDDSGDGVLHATVIYAQRGKLLRFDGPLGYSGTALQMVHTYQYEAVGDSTKLTLTVRGAGEVEENTPKIVADVWRHFLFDRLKPYVAARRTGPRPQPR